MTEPQPAMRGWRPSALLAALLVVVIGAAAYALWRRQAPLLPTPAATGPVLIVLPLHPLGSQHDEGVLAEGLSEELIGRLAGIDGLRVIARTSALRAATDHLDATQLAQRLGVTHTLRGRLHQSGDELDVELHLAQIQGGELWTQQYEWNTKDVATIERDITRAVAEALKLRLTANTQALASVNPREFFDLLEARRLADGPQRPRGIDQLRDLVAAAPDYARAQATLARLLTTSLRPGASPRPGSYASEDFDEAALAAARARALDPQLAEAHAALAVLSCRTGDWAACMESFQRALELDRSDVETRIAYAYWLVALGYVERALHETETAWQADPLSYNATFARARLLDTAGQHAEATQYLQALSSQSSGLVYAKWHNAVWRHDFASAARLAALMPRGEGFREAYIVVSEALVEPRLWPQALPLIATSERANNSINVQRIMMPNPDYAVVVAGLEKMMRDGWPSYYMLLWMPEYAPMRRDPAFQDFLKRTRLLDYWRAHGFPAQCHAQGDGARCD